MTLPKGQKTKIRIITASTDLFLTEGLYNITFSKIAIKAKITQPAIYKHFKNMDDLFLESCHYWVGESLKYINENSYNLESAHLQMKQYVDRHFIYSVKNRAHDALLFGLYYYSIRSKKMFHLYSEIKKRSIDRLSRILLFGNIDGSWNIDHPEEVASTIHSILVGEVIKLLIEPSEMASTEAQQRIAKHFSKLIA